MRFLPSSAFPSELGLRLAFGCAKRAWRDCEGDSSESSDVAVDAPRSEFELGPESTDQARRWWTDRCSATPPDARPAELRQFEFLHLDQLEFLGQVLPQAILHPQVAYAGDSFTSHLAWFSNVLMNNLCGSSIWT